MTRPKFGDVRWVTWGDLCEEAVRAGPEGRSKETGMTPMMADADALALRHDPSAIEQKWWQEPVWFGTRWPGVEFGIVGGVVAMLRKSSTANEPERS